MNGTSNATVANNDQMELKNNINFWWNAVIIPIGIVGNILCLLVVSQKQNRSISCSVYMGALGVADCLVLIAKGMGIYMISSPVGVFHKYVCKVMAFILSASSQSGSVIILTLLAERVIVVTKPLKAASLLTPKRALVITLILVLLLALFNIPVILSGTALVTGQCMAVPGSSAASVIYNVLTVFISGVLPLCGILIMNLIILCAIKSSVRITKKQRSKKCGSYRQRIDTISQKIDSKKLPGPADSHNIEMSMSSVSARVDPSTDGEPACGVSDVDVTARHQAPTEGAPACSVSDVDVIVRHHPESDCVPACSVSDVDEGTKQQQEKMSKRQKQLTIMTMAMTMAFVICVMPWYSVRVILLVNDWPLWGYSSTLDLVTMVLHNLYVLNSAINFFLYAMAGSKFRSDLMTLLHLN